MINIWSDYSTQINPFYQQVLRDCAEVSKQLNIPILVVGAFARDIIFAKHKQTVGRKTIDLDLAISVGTKEDFSAMCQYLIAKGTYKETRLAHRLIYNGLGADLEVDLVPFGKIENPPGSIQWPDDFRMNLLGFEEALANANPVKFGNEPELILSVLSLPAFVILKLIAWDDRKDRSKKDAMDLRSVLKWAADLNGFHVSEEAQQFFTDQEVDLDILAAWDLGADIRKITKTKTEKCLHRILKDETDATDQSRLIQAMGAREGEDGKLIDCLKALLDGMQH